MTGYEEFQRIMAEINYKKQMEENRKNFSLNYNLPSEFEQLFNGFKK